MSRSWAPMPRRRSAAASPPGPWRRLLDYALAALLLGLLALVAAWLDRVETRREQGVPVVNDGDSITLGRERIRLRGIDAPEYTQICLRDGAEYPCGKLARQSLVGLIAGRPVSCSGWQRDRYGRLLGDCKAGETDLNRSQVQTGWAIAYGDFEADQASARTAKAGIWAGTFEEPQQWRRDHRDAPVESRHGWPGSFGNALREILRF